MADLHAFSGAPPNYRITQHPQLWQIHLYSEGGRQSFIGYPQFWHFLPWSLPEWLTAESEESSVSFVAMIDDVTAEIGWASIKSANVNASANASAVFLTVSPPPPRTTKEAFIPRPL